MVPRSLAVPILFLAPMLNGLAQEQGKPPANAPPEAAKIEAPKVPSSVPPDATGLPIDPKSYVIGPEDIIHITVWREPDLSGVKGVRPDGKITMPLIGDVQASGLTPERLTAQLKQGLSEFVKQPEVTVEVLQVNSKSYTIAGEVNRPGRYPLVIPKTVFEAINDASGFRDFANKKDIIILRKDGTRLHFNYNDFVKGKHAEKNIQLQNGDAILVKD